MTILKCVGCTSFFFHPGLHSDGLQGILGTLHPSPITLLRRVLIHFVGSFLKTVHFHIQVKTTRLIHLDEK